MNESQKADIDQYIGNVLEIFDFNKDYEHSTNAGIVIAYKHPSKKIYIRFGYDFRDRQFAPYIYSVKGDYIDKQKMFWKIFMEMEPNLDFADIQPKGLEYLPALKKNSELLTQFLHLWLVEGKDDLIKEILE